MKNNNKNSTKFVFRCTFSSRDRAIIDRIGITFFRRVNTEIQGNINKGFYYYLSRVRYSFQASRETYTNCPPKDERTLQRTTVYVYNDRSKVLSLCFHILKGKGKLSSRRNAVAKDEGALRLKSERFCANSPRETKIFHIDKYSRVFKDIISKTFSNRV